MVTDTGAPDGPGPLRFLNQPRLIQVQTGSEGELIQVNLRGRWQTVEEVLDTWRIDDEWWREQPIHRTYYEVDLEEGTRIMVFCDLVDIQWYEQRG